MISMIVAMTPERVIGRDGGMPWHLPADLTWFKTRTLGKPVVMGRKTWDSIGSRPLPGRKNIIISRSEGLSSENVKWVQSQEQAIEQFSDAGEIMIIGGEQIYTRFLLQSERLYITLIHTHIAGDSYFPKYDYLGWQQSFSEERAADGKNPYDCTFMVLDRLP